MEKYLFFWKRSLLSEGQSGMIKGKKPAWDCEGEGRGCGASGTGPLRTEGGAEMEEAMEFTERKRMLFFGLPFTFTKYMVREDMITINAGFFKTVENDCYMYKVQDVQHSATLAEKLFGLGTVTCFTGDTTHPQLLLCHIRHSKEVKDFILEASEKARLKRRTVNMLDIGSGDLQDMDDPE